MSKRDNSTIPPWDDKERRKIAERQKMRRRDADLRQETCDYIAKLDPGPRHDAATELFEVATGAALKRAESLMEHKEALKEHRETYKKALSRAVYLGMLDHPIVREWVAMRTMLGDKDTLRDFRNARKNGSRGLEVGVSRCIDDADFWIAFHAAPLVEGRGTLEEIRLGLLALSDGDLWPNDAHWDSRSELDREKLRASIRKRLGTKVNLCRRLVGMGIHVRSPAWEDM